MSDTVKTMNAGEDGDLKKYDGKNDNYDEFKRRKDNNVEMFILI